MPCWGSLDTFAVDGDTVGNMMSDSHQRDTPGNNGLGPHDIIARARQTLEPVQRSLEEAGFYAYGTVDEENRWVISADDEAGHVDVRVGPDGFQIDLWTTSPEIGRAHV